MSLPRTEAGLALYQSLQARQSQSAEPISTLPQKGWPFLDAILAIEAEARAQGALHENLAEDELERVREGEFEAAIERQHDDVCGCPFDGSDRDCNLAGGVWLGSLRARLTRQPEGQPE